MTQPTAGPTPDPEPNHQDTKNTKQEESLSVLTIFVSLCLCGDVGLVDREYA